MRERWFGATGRRVPAIVLAGSLDLTGAVVLDRPPEEGELERLHAAGTPIVVRASDAAGVAAALAHPQVACAIVDDSALLALDLPELTYGAS